jgi:hypothetical protein
MGNKSRLRCIYDYIVWDPVHIIGLSSYDVYRSKTRLWYNKAFNQLSFSSHLQVWEQAVEISVREIYKSRVYRIRGWEVGVK